MTAAAPGTSSFGRPAGRESAITDGARATTSAATGTLTKKAQRQDSRSVSSPPRIAPAVNPADIRAPLRPRARSRRGPSLKAVVSSASPAGVTAAVARPCRTRAVSSTSGRWRVRRARRRARGRPSADEQVLAADEVGDPAEEQVNPAAASAKEVAIHWRWPREKPRPAPTAGSATFRIEKSTAIMNWEPRSRTRTSLWRLVMREAGVRGG